MQHPRSLAAHPEPMSKRKTEERWNQWAAAHPKCKKPKWPQDGEAWTEEDWLQARTINGLALEPGSGYHPQHDGKGKPPHSGQDVLWPDGKLSRLVQALDLAKIEFFDYWYVDAWKPLPALPSTVVRIRNLPCVPRFIS